jgi:HAD superfamily hydrolase (TIGR01484 family)
MDEQEKLKEIQTVLRAKYRDIISLTFSKPKHLEVNSVSASKGAAVKTIAEFYGIHREEIISLGNDENDVSMLRYAGLGAAMGNAPESVKREADVVTLTNNENGVAHIINTYL